MSNKQKIISALAAALLAVLAVSYEVVVEYLNHFIVEPVIQQSK
jgi:hypothetical protein